MKRFVKGVFENLPALPRYSTIWDVDIALEFLKEIYPHSGYSLMELSHKLVFLLTLVTAQKAQTLRCLHVNNLIMDNAKCVTMLNKN